MIDYDPGPTRPDLAEKVASLREHGMSVSVYRMESQIARADGSAYEPVWGCEIRSGVRACTGEGATEHEAFEEAHGRLPDLSAH